MVAVGQFTRTVFVHLRVVGSVRVVERGHLVFRGAEDDGVAPPRVLLPQLRIALRHLSLSLNCSQSEDGLGLLQTMIEVIDCCVLVCVCRRLGDGDARAVRGDGGEFAGRKICMLRNRLGRGEGGMDRRLGALDAEFMENLSRGRRAVRCRRARA